MIVQFIIDHKSRWGVEPICRVLSENQCKIAPSTYYDAVRRPASLRAVRHEFLEIEIARVHRENYSVYGARKVWLALNREGIAVARCTVEDLMADLGLRGAVRGKVKRTTIADPQADRAGDLVDRKFNPKAPNMLWVADFTYVSTWSGWVYVAFVIDAYARRIVGWRSATTMTTQLVLDAIEHAIWTRNREGVQDLSGLIHHNDRGAQTRLNRSKQHSSMREVRNGTTTRLGGRYDGTSNDAFPGASAGAQGSRACFLGADRQGAHKRRGCAGMRRVGAGRNAVVPSRWGDATYRVDPALGEVSDLRRA